MSENLNKRKDVMRLTFEWMERDEEGNEIRKILPVRRTVETDSPSKNPLIRLEMLFHATVVAAREIVDLTRKKR